MANHTFTIATPWQSQVRYEQNKNEMNRKLYLLGLLLLFFHASLAQRTFEDTFNTAEGEKISIEVIDYAKFGISNAFVIVANDESEYSQLKKRLKAVHPFKNISPEYSYHLSLQRGLIVILTCH